MPYLLEPETPPIVVEAIAAVLRKQKRASKQTNLFRLCDVHGSVSIDLHWPVGPIHRDISLGPQCFATGVFVTRLSAAVDESPSLLELIDRVCADPESLEENEPAPSVKAITDLKALITEASVAMGTEVISGDVAPYFGEVSVTWRADNRMLRVTAFPDAQPRIDFGTTPEGALGDYRFDPEATGLKLAEKLSWLHARPNEERQADVA